MPGRYTRPFGTCRGAGNGDQASSACIKVFCEYRVLYVKLKAVQHVQAHSLGILKQFSVPLFSVNSSVELRKLSSYCTICS